MPPELVVQRVFQSKALFERGIPEKITAADRRKDVNEKILDMKKKSTKPYLV